MVLVMLMLSLGWVFVVWILSIMADFGLTVGMLIAYPFIWLWEKFFKKPIKVLTPEEAEARLQKMKDEADGRNGGLIYNEHFDIWC